MTNAHHGVALACKPAGKMAADKATTPCNPDGFLDAVATENTLLTQRMLPKELAATEMG